MIVLLSSDFRPRYSDDIIRILALPRGGQLQLRYGASLLTAGVQGCVPREQLAGEAALICFVADANASTPFALVPVRFVTIIRAEKVGTSYIFTVAADAFVTALTDAEIRAAASSTDQQRLPAPPGASPTAGEIFAFGGTEAWREHKSLSLDTFEATAERLAAHTTFNAAKSAFFTVVRVSEVRARSWFGTWPQPRRLNQGAFDLRAGKRYECEVYCLRLYEPPKAVPIEPNPGFVFTTIASTSPKPSLGAEANDSWVHFGSAKRSIIDSRYDVKRFLFEAEPDVVRRVSGIRLFLTEGLDESSTDYQQDITLSLIFRGSIFWAIIRAILIGIATAGPSMIAINAAGKLNAGAVAAVIALGALAGAAAIFPTIRKP
ncbi:hypothetical protein [Rhizorhabdus argentea]|uniref:hypothetical protein n=1 Tax=Rhizorhabdus argentea TaxID=1387174 RepID=UPI0030ED29B5